MHARVRRLKVGAASLDAIFARMPNSFFLDLRAAGGAPAVTLDVPLPPGARGVRVLLDSVPSASRPVDTPVGRRVTIEIPPGGRHVVSVEWEGGLEVMAGPGEHTLTPGQRSAGVRILDVTATGGGWEVLLEGERGRTYDLRLFGARPLTAVGAGADAAVEPSALFYEFLRVSFPGGAGRATARVRLSP
jgi:hypothetical protein